MANITTPIIEINQIRTYVQLSKNTQADIVNPIITSVQLQQLRTILCDDFYAQIVEEVSTNTFTGQNEALYNNFIVPFLAYAFMARYTATGNLQHTPTGQVKQNDPNSEKVDDFKLKSMVQIYNDDALTYRGALISYLNANKASYQLWAESNCANCPTEEGHFYFSRIQSNKRLGNQIYIDNNEL
jgi:hypothetical protein